MNNIDIKFPYYSGNIKFTKSQGLVTLDYFIKSQINPKQNVKDVIDKISKLNSIKDKQQKRLLKHKLFSFTPSVIIKKDLKRGYINVLEYTGLMQLDFDKMESEEEANIMKYNLFENYDFIICSYLSPSKRGVKCLARIKKPRDKEHYKAIHKAMQNLFKENKHFDKATNNAMLPLFLSYDSNMLYTDISDCNEFNKEDWSKIKYVNLNNKKSLVKLTNYEKNRTNNIFINKINNIVSDGHTQLRSACLILGSRAGAGYITIDEAISLAENCINLNNYLQKDLNNYKSTSVWAIEQGFKNPKFYK